MKIDQTHGDCYFGLYIFISLVISFDFAVLFSLSLSVWYLWLVFVIFVGGASNDDHMQQRNEHLKMGFFSWDGMRQRRI